jgi:uncharacterized membrane protein YphA (DoxX/SURF4 family)/peroxiredoxin
MSILITLVRLMLSVVFGVAGVTKLLDPSGTREAMTNFGAPKSVSPSLAVVLPMVEIAIAIGLLFGATAWWSALAALAILAIFVVAIGVNLARGKTHECHCFGQIYSRPLGWPTMARNLVFALGAVLVMWNAPASQAEMVSTLTSAANQLDTGQALLLLLGAAIVAAALVYLGRRKPVADHVHDEPVGLPLDAEAPEFDLPDYDGGRRSLAQLQNLGKPVLLIFTNPKCGPCIHLFKEINDWQTAHNDQLTITLVTMGTIKDNFVNVARNRLGQVLLQENNEVSQLYGARATPSAGMVSTDGRIASRVAEGSEEIRALLQSFVQGSNGAGESHPPHHQDPSQEPGIQHSHAIQ